MPLRRSRKKQMGQKLNGAHQLLAYANDVNLLADNIGTVKGIEKL
jgi:hypothetical protein